MYSRYLALIVLCAVIFTGVAPAALAQQQGEGSPAQRLEVMRSKLDATRRSLNNAISSINAQDGTDKEKDKSSPEGEALGRLRGLEREVGSVLSDVANLRVKVDRAERYEAKDLDKLEVSVNDILTRSEAGLVATSSLRKTDVAAAPKKKKKKGKFFGLFGGGDDDKYEELTSTIAPGRDRELFEMAVKEVRKNSYETGRLLFNTIITTYPDSQFLPLAKLAIADSFYLEGTSSGLIQASAGYQDWLTFFPSDPLADDVMLKVAESEMRQMGLADRDVSRARKAEQRLKVLLQQYPETPLRADAELRLKEVQENLGMHNLKIADFYLARSKNEKGGLKGAQNRLLEIIEKWPSFSYMDKVLYNTAYTYQQEEEPDEAAKYYQRLVRFFPNSEYVEKATDQLNIMGAAIPEADPKAKMQLPPERPGMVTNLKNEIFGIQPVTVSKNGILISKEKNEGGDLIDVAIARGGVLPDSSTPQAPRTRPRSTPPSQDTGNNPPAQTPSTPE